MALTELSGPDPPRPRLLDLFCGEGGAGAGYMAAGFAVTGVDVRRLRGRYPGRFVRGDALTYLAAHAAEFDAVHASPPCQTHTSLRSFYTDADPGLFDWARHVDLIAETRAALVAAGLPWVIENVPNAPLLDPVVLCGGMFALAADCRDGVRRPLRRHRLFETSFELAQPPHPAHRRMDEPVGVYGHGGGGAWRRRGGYMAVQAEAVQAIGAPWMTMHGLAQAVPPAYTEHIGRQLAPLIVRRASPTGAPGPDMIRGKSEPGGLQLPPGSADLGDLDLTT
jgi:DNA (cytosine-5)-methyltransferase 1